jgi:tRNA-splicing endonuclease subunit Sen15, fungi type
MQFPPHLEGLAKVVRNNLEHQQDWKHVTSHSEPSQPRPLLSGLPPRRMYVHPDEQIDIIKAEKAMGTTVPHQKPDYEWVMPIHISEKPTLRAFSAIFDALDALPPATNLAEAEAEAGAGGETVPDWRKWRGAWRGKRVLLAIVHDDSTVVYYMMHDGIVKPRQN